MDTVTPDPGPVPGPPAGEFTPEPGLSYLNTASHGLLPARSAGALHAAVARMSGGRIDLTGAFAAVEAARASFARLAGVEASRVATGVSTATHVGLVAAALPSGAEVLAAEGEFSSLVGPFSVRDDLRSRTVPLPELAGAVGPETALVAVSAVRSDDGRITDLPAIRAAARAVGARVLVDTTQATGWLPVDAGAVDLTVCSAYKWLLCPRGVAFLTVSDEAYEAGFLTPLHAGWVAAEHPWESVYGPLTRLAPNARRFDEGPALLPYLAAERSLALVEEVGQEALGARARALAARFRAGLLRLGHRPVAAEFGESAVVAVPGLGHAVGPLADAGVVTSARDGNLRAAFYLYNTEHEVDHALNVLEGVGD
ncbi:aminotransferase class V-fold PLP-dependent enzyme [Streptomyces sp. AJS327]|uniref:aminotransferase class V-fold PLP-dependent enzyme n=1 Tax=Streptomyces sp. AJS327 TaxID=2545265 RepID=UPI0015E0260B|nr:aminotransferase class V-fold PLP-dependent enzyme [Streptomyces sp. AJS327]MBA0050471.1 aminotransferase class V-fold PLP-dependent enzyme [Streptomyces sp. AJS327]